MPQWSPDGTRLGFRSQNGGRLAVVPHRGGRPRLAHPCRARRPDSARRSHSRAVGRCRARSRCAGSAAAGHGSGLLGDTQRGRRDDRRGGERERNHQIQPALDGAQSAGVVFSALDPGGVRGNEGTGAEYTTGLGQLDSMFIRGNDSSGARLIAAETGGRYVSNVNDLDQAMAILEEARRPQTLLGRRCSPAGSRSRAALVESEASRSSAAGCRRIPGERRCGSRRG